MTPEQVLEKMVQLYGSEDNFENPEHYPRTFKHQVDMAKWMLELESKKSSIQPTSEQQEKSSLDPEPEV